MYNLHNTYRPAGAAGTASDPGSTDMAIGGTVTDGTSGSILFVGAGPVLAQDNANLWWDATNHQLGLGAGTAANPSFSFKADPDTGVYHPGTNQVGISAGGTLRATFDSSGLTLPFARLPMSPTMIASTRSDDR